MPITAIPQGVEIRKITAVQKRALDELLGKQKETSLLQTLIPSFSFIAVASIGAYIYIKRDTIKEELLELEETIRQMAGRGVTEAFTTFGETVTGVPRPDTPTYEPETGTIFENMTTCQLFEYDVVELFSRMDNANFFEKFAIGFNLQQKYRGMKQAGCSKPPRVDQHDWDKA